MGLVMAVVLAVAGHGPGYGATTGDIRFARPPVVLFDMGEQRTAVVTVFRLTKPLPVGGHGPAATVGTREAHDADYALPIWPIANTRWCYRQELEAPRGTIVDAQLVTVRLAVRGARRQVLLATVPAHPGARWFDDRAEAATARDLGCPSAGERRCGRSFAGTIFVDAVSGGATCAVGRSVMRSVDARDDASYACYGEPCVQDHPAAAGFRCSVAKIGEADWTITCRRGRQTVRGSASD